MLKQENKVKYLNDTTATYTKAYNTIYSQHKELSDVIFSGIINLANVDDKLEAINSKDLEEQKQIRKDLYIQTYKRFNSLKSKFVTDIEYVLPNDKIFLSMEKPLTYYEKNKQLEDIFELVKNSKEPQDTYQITAENSGFLFVYPVLKNGNFLGIVTITFDEQSFTSSIMKQYSVMSNMIIKGGEFQNKLLKNNPLYTQAHLPGFLHKKNILKEMETLNDVSIAKIKPKINITRTLYNQGMKKIPKSYYLDKGSLIVTTIPIINKIDRETKGFITILSKDNAINLITKNYFTIAILLVIIYFALFLLLMQQKIKVITDKERLEEIIKKDQQILEQAKLAQMGEMIGNIAHQWRQPLSAISTLASGMKINYEFGLLKNEEIPKNMDLIVENTKYLSDTIDTFRDFTKKDKIKRPIVLQEKLDECLNIVSASISSSYIKIINEIDYTYPIVSEVISGELSQVIINLLNNAKDAIVQNNVEDGWIQISLKDEDNKAKIVIKDNGGGIKDDVTPKIFDPYFTTKHQYQGTGLGLYMSKVIVEKHLNGKLEFENDEDGAIFTIILDKN